MLYVHVTLADDDRQRLCETYIIGVVIFRLLIEKDRKAKNQKLKQKDLNTTQREKSTYISMFCS